MAEAALPQRPAAARGREGASRAPVPAGLLGLVGRGWVGAGRAGSCSRAARCVALPEPRPASSAPAPWLRPPQPHGPAPPPAAGPLRLRRSPALSPVAVAQEQAGRGTRAVCLPLPWLSRGCKGFFSVEISALVGVEELGAFSSTRSFQDLGRPNCDPHTPLLLTRQTLSASFATH